MSKIIGSLLGTSLATAAVVLAVAGAANAQGIKANPGPQPGQCKTIMEVGIAPSPAAAQQMWTTTVNGKFGQKWAVWVGAKDKVVVPINNGTLYQALAKPCFYQPVP